MYPVAHVAAAVGGIWFGERLLIRVHTAERVASVIDYRLVAAGALLPDVIDKPLARAGIDALSYEETAGHAIGHTLVAAVAVIAAGLLLARRGDFRLLWLGLGSATHLLVDPVILHPSVLLWPLFGTDFPESKGIPSWPHLFGFDVLLVAATVQVYWRRRGFRERVWRLLRRGDLSPRDVRAT